MAMTLLIGGARAGKSSLAARRAEASGRTVTFVATAQALDDEMAARIARHQADRPPSWTTIEEPAELAVALRKADPDAAVIVDCLTLWTTNLMLAGHEEDEIAQRAAASASLAGDRDAPTFVVTNEVGSGVVPGSELGRQFRDVLGRVNSIWASEAAEAFLVVAGRALPLERWD
ncbi:MAG TPA: bifunctional adenosylcobinamide kinase/adenosylcobinamide-phosphate guanylyltransferase [Actinomycetota bacterium]|jgi:adenosyl cobinamide kinase/adenosyl cobinamide phosphate guanylyltransferase